ncbi:MAG: hypothetical protein E7363_06180 [Clostridiales bacterium]|nr:hypothetical protein [Clostridiales bacterium]
MKFIDYKDIKTQGELKFRAEKNLQRMESEPYKPEKIFQDASYNWPGDWEGRTLLALVSDEKTLHVEARYLKEIMSLLEGHLNEHKYFGKKLEQVLSEQLLASNSWFLRAMCEHYIKNGDAQSREIILSVTENLLAKTLPYYEKYPTDMSIRQNIGEAMGDLLQIPVNDWQLSTDTGCAFIPLDGYTAVYELFPSETLKQLIIRAIEIFASIDKAGIRCQTHATLSGTRGILRFYRLTGERKYLEMAKELFTLYEEQGMTVNYANYNWFCRPEWTEGCAVVDSFIVAMELFAFTGEYKYAQALNRIYKNAFRFSQRYNGGLGCDICTTEDQPVLTPGQGVFEAFWCCSMRCGEGIYRLSSAQYLTRGKEVFVPLYNDNEATLLDGKVKVTQKVNDWNASEVTFAIAKADTAFILRLYVPEFATNVRVNGEKAKIENGFAVVEVTSPQTLTLSFDLPVTKDACRGKTRYFVGDLMLGKIVNGEGRFGKTYQINGETYYEIVNMILQNESSKDIKQEVIF